MEEYRVDPLEWVDAERIRQALRDWFSPRKLGNHELAWLRIVTDPINSGGYFNLTSRGEALRSVLNECIQILGKQSHWNSAELNIIIEGIKNRVPVIHKSKKLGNIPMSSFHVLQNKVLEELANILREKIERHESKVYSAPSGYQGLFLAPPISEHAIVGREDFITLAKNDLILNKRLVLHGLPGVGKTAIAVLIAHDADILRHFSDGILWAGVGQKPTAFALLGEWARAIGVNPDQVAQFQTAQELSDLLRAELNNKKILLVADDIWSLEVAQMFNVGGPNCGYVITSRLNDIAVSFGDAAIDVPELSVDSGINLFESLAPNAVKKDRQLAKSLVQAVGGLPLAIRLLGFYLNRQDKDGKRRLLTLMGDLDDIQKRLNLASEVEPIGHFPNLKAKITLRAVISLSFDSLPPAAQVALRYLTVLPAKPNTFSLLAARAICKPIKDELDLLHNYRLVEVINSRLTIHQTIADFAFPGKLIPEASERMVDYYITYSTDHKLDYSDLNIDLENIMAGLDISETFNWNNQFVILTNNMYDFMNVRGYYNIAQEKLSKARNIAKKDNDTQKLAETLLNLGRIKNRIGKYREAVEDLQEAINQARQSKDVKLVAETLSAFAGVQGNQGNYEDAEQSVREALDMIRQIEDPESLFGILLQLGASFANRGHYKSALEYFHQAIPLASEVRHQESICELHHKLGWISANIGDFDNALTELFKALDIAQRIGHREYEVTMLFTIGAIKGRNGDTEASLEYYEKSQIIAEEIGNLPRVAINFGNMGVAKGMQGKFQEAHELFDKGLKIARDIGNHWIIVYILLNKGGLYSDDGKFDISKLTLEEALEMSRTYKLKEHEGMSLLGLAKLFAYQDYIKEAYDYGNQSLVILKEIEHNMLVEAQKWLDSLPPR